MLDDCFPPTHIVEYVEKSLQNLAIETMDLIQFYVWEDSWASVSTTIPGMRKLAHVQSNLATSDGKELSPDLLAELKRHRWDRTPTEWSQ